MAVSATFTSVKVCEEGKPAETQAIFYILYFQGTLYDFCEVRVNTDSSDILQIREFFVELIYFLSEFHHAFIAVHSVQCSEINAVEQEFLDLLRMVSGHFFCNDFRYLGSYFRIVQLCVVLCQCGIILVLVRFILLHGLAI